jgi:hypothetical protein
MKGFVPGADREQSTPLPECLDDFINESNPVRVIDAFVDARLIWLIWASAALRRLQRGDRRTIPQLF